MAMQHAWKLLAHYNMPLLVRALASAPAARSNMALIKELREKSGAPISDVKSCLEQSNWEVELAYDLLRKRGLAAAAKKASRLAAEGLVGVSSAPGLAAVVEINSETDFVPRNQLFKDLVSSVAKAAANLPAAAVSMQNQVDLECLKQLHVPGSSATVQELVASVAAQVRENVQLRRAYLVTSPGIVGTYVHNSSGPGLGSIASIVTLAQPGQATPLAGGTGQARDLADSIAMHAVGKRALFLDRLSVPEEVIEKERKLLTEQAAASGKAGKFVQKMIEGRLSKWYEEVCLSEQKYLLDDTVRVTTLLERLSADMKLQPPLQLVGMMRVECGEGLRGADAPTAFADEVAAIIKG